MNQLLLDVRYFSQRDNYRDASRTCFTSSCAMLLDHMKPGAIAGDDDYLAEVVKHGDSTDPAAQLKALDHFYLQASFHQNGGLDTIKELLQQGRPVPCGILHHGPCNAACGGGHWICAIGFRDDTAKPGGGTFIVHDPWGEIDNASGVYVNTNGAHLEYSYELFRQRWSVASDHDGWYIGA